MAKRKLDNETLQPIGDQVTLDPADILVVEEDNLRHFPPTAAEISALADSIKKNGQMQPVLVRALGVEDAFLGNGGDNPSYKLILGYRRYAAVAYAREHLGLEDLPVLARVVSGGDEMSLNLNLAENLERRELGPMDVAYAITRFKTRGEDGKTIGARFKGLDGKPKSRAWVTQTGSLTTLRPKFQKEVQEGKLSQTHARMLVGLDDEKQDDLYEKIKSGKLTSYEAAAERQKRKTKKDNRGKKASPVPSIKAAAKVFDTLAAPPEKGLKLTASRKLRWAVAEIVAKFLHGKIGAAAVARLLEKL